MRPQLATADRYFLPCPMQSTAPAAASCILTAVPLKVKMRRVQFRRTAITGLALLFLLPDGIQADRCEVAGQSVPGSDYHCHESSAEAERAVEPAAGNVAMAPPSAAEVLVGVCVSQCFCDSAAVPSRSSDSSFSSLSLTPRAANVRAAPRPAHRTTTVGAGQARNGVLPLQVPLRV